MISLPSDLLNDDNHQDPISLPPSIAEIPETSSPHYTLYRLVRHLKPKSVLEIGTQSGCSALTMSLAQRDNQDEVDILCIDPFYPCGDNNGLETLSEWHRLIRGGGMHGVNLALTTSELFIPLINKKFDLIFVDGSHDYENVKVDCLLSLRSLKKGGYVVAHDTSIYDGVKRAVVEVISDFNLPWYENKIQRNYRGELCGWIIFQSTSTIDREKLDSAIEAALHDVNSKLLPVVCEEGQVQSCPPKSLWKKILPW